MHKKSCIGEPAILWVSIVKYTGVNSQVYSGVILWWPKHDAKNLVVGQNHIFCKICVLMCCVCVVNSLITKNS